MRGYHVIFHKRVVEIKELDVRLEATSANEAIVRAAREVPDDGWEFARVEVTADDGGVDEVVV